MKNYKIISIAFFCILVNFQIKAQINYDFFNLNKNPKNYFTVIPYIEMNDKMIVEAEIKDKKYKFIFDTGATLSLIKKEIAEELKLQIINSLEVTDHSDKRGMTELALIKKFKFGDLEFSYFPVILVNDNFVLECLEVDGIIGNNMLLNSAIQFSHTNKTITITDQVENFTLHESNAVQLGFGQETGLPYVNVKFIGTVNDTIQTYLLFDTGMNTLLSIPTDSFDETIKNVEVFKIITEISGSNSVGLFGVSDSKKQYLLDLPALNIGNTNINHVQLFTDAGVTGKLGSEIFRHGLVTLDYTNMKFYFESFTDTNVDLKKKNWPLFPVLVGEELIVGAVVGDELKKQIKVGDKITGMDDINFETLSMCDFIKGAVKNKNDKAIFRFRDKDTGMTKTIEINKILF